MILDRILCLVASVCLLSEGFSGVAESGACGSCPCQTWWLSWGSPLCCRMLAIRSGCSSARWNRSSVCSLPPTLFFPQTLPSTSGTCGIGWTFGNIVTMPGLPDMTSSPSSVSGINTCVILRLSCGMRMSATGERLSATVGGPSPSGRSAELRETWVQQLFPQRGWPPRGPVYASASCPVVRFNSPGVMDGGGEKVPGGPIQVCSRCLVSTTFGWWLTTSACLQKRTCSGRRVSWRLIAAWWSRRLLHNVVTRGATSNSITVLAGTCRWCAVDVPDSFATTTSATTLSTALDASHASSLEMGRRRDGSGLRSPSPPSPTGPGVVGELMEMEVSKRL